MRLGYLASFGFILIAGSTVAFASDGTMTFSGTVTGQTCTITGNGGSGGTFTVTLPTLSVSSLTADGTIAGRTPFTVALSSCSPTTGNVSVYFEPGATIDTTTGRLLNATGTATHVEISLLNANLTSIVLGNSQSTEASQIVALSSGAATLKYYAQYVGTGAAATAGTVITTVTYSIVYQ